MPWTDRPDEHGMTLVTGNTREFNRVPGLSVENWLAS
jgi:predicted nucleic acid-binding protein